MRRLISAIILLALGCGGSSSPPPAAAPAPAQKQESVGPVVGHGSCEYFLYALKMVGDGDNHPAFGIAAAAADEGEAADQAGDSKAAARKFLDCARAFRDVPDDHVQRSLAAENAGYCYKNAYYCFGKANAFKSEGRAVLEKARGEDPRMATVLDELLAKDPDCP